MIERNNILRLSEERLVEVLVVREKEKDRRRRGEKRGGNG